MILEILSAEEKVYSGEVDSVIFPEEREHPLQLFKAFFALLILFVKRIETLSMLFF